MIRAEYGAMLQVLVDRVEGQTEGGQSDAEVWEICGGVAGGALLTKGEDTHGLSPLTILAHTSHLNAVFELEDDVREQTFSECKSAEELLVYLARWALAEDLYAEVSRPKLITFQPKKRGEA